MKSKKASSFQCHQHSSASTRWRKTSRWPKLKTFASKRTFRSALRNTTITDCSSRLSGLRSMRKAWISASRLLAPPFLRQASRLWKMITIRKPRPNLSLKIWKTTGCTCPMFLPRPTTRMSEQRNDDSTQKTPIWSNLETKLRQKVKTLWETLIPTLF